MQLSIIIPVRDEAATIGDVVRGIRSQFPTAEVLVVDDGSTDRTPSVAEEQGARVIRNLESMGNGAAAKAGARAAEGEILVFFDADGQNDPADIPRLLEKLDEGYEMVVGTCSSSSHATTARQAANGILNVIPSMITGHRIPDLNSGFRAVKAELFRKFLYLLPNGFSCPTTITMAFMRAGYPVEFLPLVARESKGKSHNKPVRDSLRFMIIIFNIATLYAPLKLFMPTSFAFFVLGLGSYLYTYATLGQFTNLSFLLFSAAVIVFLIGLISEQLTALSYQDT